MKFVDLVRVHVSAGHGGVGCVSFRREKFVPRGGPDGGDGGRGGDVILLASRHLSTLLDFQYKNDYAAQRGEHGLGARKTGSDGRSITLKVPVGTVIRDVATGETIADLVHDGDGFVVARGGRGGRGNAQFATSTNQAPRQYGRGEPGEERTIEMELKLLADVGLVGLPNAGKSTLISVISAARPKIADYPFTTLVPNLGIVSVDTGSSFVVADIPGLIKGAHLGKGLGVQFLRHIERTRILVILLDGTGEDLKADYKVITGELRQFNPAIARKPKLIAVTKIDALDEERLASLRKTRFGTVPVHFISAVAGTGVSGLVAAIWTRIAKA
ncbi:MAG: Small GTP-binding protein domain [Bacteroidetes bacterium]|nr:Small GTP-binding protein domain [Bacteroidota bacterium]